MLASFAPLAVLGFKFFWTYVQKISLKLWWLTTGYVDALACTCQHFGMMVHWSVSTSLGILLLLRIAGVIFATLRGRWRVGTLVHRRIGTLACWRVHVHWRGEVAGGESAPVRRQNNDRGRGGNSRSVILCWWLFLLSLLLFSYKRSGGRPLTPLDVTMGPLSATRNFAVMPIRI